MEENQKEQIAVDQLPKGSPLRQKLAHQLSACRTWDQENECDRIGYEYVSLLQGVERLLEYARSLKTSRTILDLGAGTGDGIYDIKNKFGEGLIFKATSLTWNQKLARHLGKENIFITPAETLRRVPRQSIAAITAVASLCYCLNPEMAVKRIDDVLVPGGVIKSFFLVKGLPENPVEEAGKFYNEFRKLGYDCVISSDKKVLLAIKSGRNKATTSRKLLEEDRSSLQNQLVKF